MLGLFARLRGHCPPAGLMQSPTAVHWWYRTRWARCERQGLCRNRTGVRACPEVRRRHRAMVWYRRMVGHIHASVVTRHPEPCDPGRCYWDTWPRV